MENPIVALARAMEGKEEDVTREIWFRGLVCVLAELVRNNQQFYVDDENNIYLDPEHTCFIATHEDGANYFRTLQNLKEKEAVPDILKEMALQDFTASKKKRSQSPESRARTSKTQTENWRRRKELLARAEELGQLAPEETRDPAGTSLPTESEELASCGI